MSPCLNPLTPCDLTPTQIDILKSALKKRLTAPPNVTSAELYADDGTALPRVELIALALAKTLKCDANLTALNLRSLTERAMSFAHYREFSGGWVIYLRGGELKMVGGGSGAINFTAKLRQKLQLKDDAPMQLLSVTSGEAAGEIQVYGSAVLDPMTRVHFQFVVKGSAVELMVFP